MKDEAQEVKRGKLKKEHGCQTKGFIVNIGELTAI